MNLKAGQKALRLQAVDFQLAVEIVVRGELLPRHFELPRGKVENLFYRLVKSIHDCELFLPFVVVSLFNT